MTGERVDPVVPLDPDTRDAIRDLCEGVAILAVRCAPMIGTDDAGVVCGLAKRLSERMDALDQENPGLLASPAASDVIAELCANVDRLRAERDARRSRRLRLSP